MAAFALAMVAYFLSAIVVVVDKFLVSRKVGDPLVYAFFVGVLNVAAFFLWPLDFSFLPVALIVISILGGICYFFAFYALYLAMLKEEISGVVSIIGGMTAIILFVLSSLFLGERLPVFWAVSLFVLVAGSLLLSFEKRFSFSLLSLIAALFFAFSFFFTKLVFLETSFLNGFVWMRAGTFLAGLAVLIFPQFRRRIFRSPLKKSGSLSAFFIGNKTVGAISFLVLNYAVSLGSVTMVSALRGTEYIFVLVLAFLFSIFYPKLITESFSFKASVQKIAGIILISAGVILLFFT